MSPISESVERLARQHDAPVLSVLEYFLARAAIREVDGGMLRDEAELAAMEDCKVWIQLWKAVGK